MPTEADVDQIFGAAPRTRDSEAFWFNRSAIESQIADRLAQNAHICLNGPTGSGKTSLALTFAEEMQRRRRFDLVVHHQIESDDDWHLTCKAIFLSCEGTLPSTELAAAEGGWSGTGPKLTASSKHFANYEEEERASNATRSWNAGSLLRYLETKRAIVVIDNAEKLSADLARRFADFGKKAVTKGYSVWFVGSGSVLGKILPNDPSLLLRFDEVTVTRLVGQGEPWAVIETGLTKLGFRHPFNSKLEREKQRRDQCAPAVFDATGGLLKATIALGRLLAMRELSRGGDSVTVADVLEAAKDLVRDGAHHCDAQIVGRLVSLRRDKARSRAAQGALWIIEAMLKVGATEVAPVANIRMSLPNVMQDTFTEALELLVEKKVVLLLGRANEKVMFVEPDLMHFYRIVSRHPDQWGFSADRFFLDGQNELPFGN